MFIVYIRYSIVANVQNSCTRLMNSDPLSITLLFPKFFDLSDLVVFACIFENIVTVDVPYNVVLSSIFVTSVSYSTVTT